MGFSGGSRRVVREDPQGWSGGSTGVFGGGGGTEEWSRGSRGVVMGDPDGWSGGSKGGEEL